MFIKMINPLKANRGFFNGSIVDLFMKKIIFICSALLMVIFAKGASQDTIAFVHDPVMAYENGTYYVYSTGENITEMTSTDRCHWTIHRGGLLHTIPVWTHRIPDFKNHIWAPDVIHWHGKWWMAYSCSSFGVNTSAIGLLQAKSLGQNVWKDKGMIIESKSSDHYNAIDPNFVIDDHNHPWLVFGSFWDGIQLVPLNGKMHVMKDAKLLTIARRYAHIPDSIVNPTSAHAGSNAIEAPFVFKHNGWYYLFVSWDYCCRGLKSNYRVVVGRSRQIYGPYLDKNGRKMSQGGGSLVIKGDKKEFEAVGHCAVYHLKNGDIFICHGYSIPRGGASILLQRHIKWDKGGWPILKL
jgi:arabinan endo-1,5-alpha-L-arabinosidase